MKKLLIGGLILIVIVSIQPNKVSSKTDDAFFALNYQDKITNEPTDNNVLHFNGTMVSFGYEYKERPKPKPKPVIKPKVSYVKPVTKTPIIASGRLSSASVSSNGLVRQTTGWASGQCTEFVAQRVPVYWRGNGGQWINNARAMGIPTGQTPKVGAIIQTRESRWGHVAIVEKIEGNKILISEQNYKGLYIVSQRWLDIGNPVIAGYIYTK